MNNVFFRIIHRTSHQDHPKMPAKLRMNAVGERGIPITDSELWSAMSSFDCRACCAVLLAASAIASPASAEEKSRDLATFLSGNLTASGQFQNYHDGSTRGVRVDIHGAPVGNAFKLVEDTVYSDGEKQHRVWRFSKVAEGRYVGQRADLIGEANVVAHGNRIEITYRAHVPTKDGKTHDLNFMETFVFTQSGTADYQLHVSLLFVPIGDAHLTVRKRPG